MKKLFGLRYLERCEKPSGKEGKYVVGHYTLSWDPCIVYDEIMVWVETK